MGDVVLGGTIGFGRRMEAGRDVNVGQVHFLIGPFDTEGLMLAAVGFSGSGGTMVLTCTLLGDQMTT